MQKPSAAAQQHQHQPQGDPETCPVCHSDISLPEPHEVLFEHFVKEIDEVIAGQYEDVVKLIGEYPENMISDLLQISPALEMAAIRLQATAWGDTFKDIPKISRTIAELIEFIMGASIYKREMEKLNAQMEAEREKNDLMAQMKEITEKLAESQHRILNQGKEKEKTKKAA